MSVFQTALVYRPLARLALSVFFLAPAGYSANFYVSPNASPSGDGSITNPWRLQQALSNTAVIKAGDTVFLRGGTYRGRYRSSLTGAAGNQITVRSYPGELARIDGHMLLPLLNTVQATDTVFQVSDASGITLGSVLRIGTEDVYVKSMSGNALTVVRGWTATTPVSYAAGTMIGLRSNIFDVAGGYTTYQGFEITSTDPVRTTLISGSAPPDITRGSGIIVNATGVKLINLVIHDTADGMFLGENAIDLEVYGCIVYNNGWEGPDRGHGHGLYIQNLTGLKRIQEVVSFNNFATGMKVFGRAASALNVDFSGIISFNNGSPQSIGKQANLYIGTDLYPADQIDVDSSVFFHTPGKGGENLHFGYSNKNNGRMSLTNSISYGAGVPLDVSYWQDITVTGNRFYVASLGTWSAQTMTVARTTSSWLLNWNNNRYFDASPLSSGVAYSYTFNNVLNRMGGGRLSYAEWKAACACDSASQYSAGTPSGQEIMIRPNANEAGRAHIAVFNWSQQPAVTVNLAGVLNVGDPYEIADAQNLSGPPLVTGTYSGAAISIPLSLTTVDAPVGAVPTPPVHTAPLFGVFVVRKQAGAASGVTVSLTPSAVSLAGLGSQQFTAALTGTTNTAVTWSLSQGVGTLSPTGFYTAPSSISAPTSVTVRAASVADPSRSASAVVSLLPPVVSVAVSPSAATVAAGRTQQLSATVSGTTNTGVTWSLSPAVGTLSATGLYTAPPTVSASTVVLAKAVSNADPAKSATATLTVTPSTVSVAVSPSAATVAAGRTQQLSATVSGTTNTGVTWSLSPAVGTLSATGLYTAPPTVSASTVVLAKAVSNADPAKSATATLTVTPSVTTVSVAVSPSAATVAAGRTQQLSATVSGTTNTGVAWSLSPAIGTISSTGLYTAPATVSASTVVLAKAVSNADPSKSATATLTVTPSATTVSVAVSPAMATVSAGRTQQVTATVLGTTNTGVTWSLSPAVGTLSATGLYTAPSTVSASTVVTVKAVSNADPSKWAAATLTVMPPVTITITPVWIEMTPGTTMQFYARVSNTSNKGVIWSLSPAIGTISATGLYTAPTTTAATRTRVLVSATSSADPTKVATATVFVER